MKMLIHNLAFGFVPSQSRLSDGVYALFRFYCGFSIADGAGLSKVFHKIDEKGGDAWSNLAFGVPEWFVQQVSDIGFNFISPVFWAHLAVYGEFIGGLLVAFGLLTRAAACQLAFQFFVVAFIWYKDPAPFAMYYQQLIFWTFALITALGGGHWSLDRWILQKQAARTGQPAPKAALTALFVCALAFGGTAQNLPANPPQRVSFTLSNPSLKTRSVSIRHFDAPAQKASGYGYDLSALGCHAANMPVGTRIYLQKNGHEELLWVIAATDDGRKIDISQAATLTREQWLQAAQDEVAEQTARLRQAAANPGMEAAAAERGIPLVALRIAGRFLWARQVYVRAQLPYEDGRSNAGFGQRVGWFSQCMVRYPVGTKIYLCDGPYWQGPVQETYLLTVTAEKSNHTIRL